MKNTACVLMLFISGVCANSASSADQLLQTDEIRIRDPFIYADDETNTYYMYAQSENRRQSGYKGVEVYTSKDLKNWNPPTRVMTLSSDADVLMVWAPEVHQYNGAFYLFVTLTRQKKLTQPKPVESEGWPPMYMRGTYIYRSDQPTGPFQPLRESSHTPEEWMALDGTLHVEEGTPYLIFCHEWVQLIDGTMDIVRLTDDLAGTVGRPQLLFRASEAPGSKQGPNEGKVTDGCFLYRSPKSNKLFMIWSTFIPGSEYCVLLTESQSGKIHGPWINQTPIYKKNGGHGMIFKSFEGRLLLALHQPNTPGRERLRLLELNDDGDTLRVK
jgi:GH43 family beta-xylosidase